MGTHRHDAAHRSDGVHAEVEQLLRCLDFHRFCEFDSFPQQFDYKFLWRQNVGDETYDFVGRVFHVETFSLGEARFSQRIFDDASIVDSLALRRRMSTTADRSSSRITFACPIGQSVTFVFARFRVVVGNRYAELIAHLDDCSQEDFTAFSQVVVGGGS